ncbi:B-cell receptor CD22-like [Colossoma macropomum]|uniref:B-cell receptor CD22-like n=1 Tax=Colossoma macropomum TaxID=42526 RepID=UPI0018651975|nr:B-cell receptor CD22-like [Colossoma macropomum]
MAPPLPLIFLLMIVGAFGAEWSVKYNQQEICALKGSTVFMNGTYTHPERLTVTETFWDIDLVQGVEPTDLSEDPDYSGRVECLTDEQKHFSLKLSDVMKKDEHQYCFRIITNEEKEKWAATPGVQLRVTELHVETPEEVTEGETADLTCKTTCNLTDPTFIWYKNGRPLTTKTIKNNQLHLQTVSSEDAGSYSCAVRGHQLNSTAHNLRVRYPPKNVSVSISPSGEIVEGSSVTLTCSSDANPPVKNYTWFKGSTSVEEGKSHNIPKIRSEDSGEYTCQSRNEHGERNSNAVQINVTYPPKNVSVSISPSGEIVEGSSVNLTCSSDANPPVKNYTWFKGSTSVGKEKNYSIPNIRSEDSGEYTCQSRNDHGERRSTAVQINVTYPPKNISVSISPSGDIVEGSSVTLTCSSDANPPVKIYTWFKGSTSVGEGKTYSIPNIRSEDSGEYTCQGRNEHGERNSTAVQINVAYSPKNVSVSISPSGEIVEGSSVNLTCSSDANPPVKIYTWFKEGGTSPVGSGQNYSIINITADHTGLYYCEAQNDLAALNGTVMDDVLYTTITHSTSRPVQAVASADSGADDGLYATVSIQNDEVTSTDQQGEPQYASVTFHHHTAATGKKRQDGTTGQQNYANVNQTGRNTPPPGDDTSSVPEKATDAIPSCNFTLSAPRPCCDPFHGFIFSHLLKEALIAWSGGGFLTVLLLSFVYIL